MKVENRVSTVESTTRICFIIHHDDEMMAPDSDLVVYDAEFRVGSTVESDSPSMVSVTLIWCWLATWPVPETSGRCGLRVRGLGGWPWAGIGVRIGNPMSSWLANQSLLEWEVAIVELLPRGTLCLQTGNSVKLSPARILGFKI